MRNLRIYSRLDGIQGFLLSWENECIRVRVVILAGTIKLVQSPKTSNIFEQMGYLDTLSQIFHERSKQPCLHKDQAKIIITCSFEQLVL